MPRKKYSDADYEDDFDEYDEEYEGEEEDTVKIIGNGFNDGQGKGTGSEKGTKSFATNGAQDSAVSAGYGTQSHGSSSMPHNSTAIPQKPFRGLLDGNPRYEGGEPAGHSNPAVSQLQHANSSTESDSSGLWRCPACTFDNPPRFLVCEVCDGQRPLLLERQLLEPGR